jgi:hypothetical protein
MFTIKQGPETAKTSTCSLSTLKNNATGRPLPSAMALVANVVEMETRFSRERSSGSEFYPLFSGAVGSEHHGTDVAHIEIGIKIQVNLLSPGS